MSKLEGECNNPTSGVHDPYWYESYVGLLYVVDLIALDSKIESVEFQSFETQKLDDVVVSYKNNIIECIQVKSTRVDGTISFENMVKDYLKPFAEEWDVLRTTKGKTIKVTLFSNRTIIDDWNGDKKCGEYLRPKLSTFWDYIKTIISTVNNVDDIVMKNSNWQTAWDKWLEAINGLKSDNKDLRLEFMKNLELILEQEYLIALEERIVEKIKLQYSVDDVQAREFFRDLAVALRHWTTLEGKNKFGNTVTHEAVLSTLHTPSNQAKGDHYIPVHVNFFESRKSFVNDLATDLKNTTKKAVFLSGKPGAGKTTIVSYLADSCNKIVDFRFHAFRPITPNNPILGADKGVSTHIGLWGDLYIQVYKYIIDNIESFSLYNMIPYVSWMNPIKLQGETLRLLGKLGEFYKKDNKKIIVAIDGIDHAARSGEKESFLRTFCLPDNIPDNVCFLISGQLGYAEYPDWILISEYTLQRCVPDIGENDIQQLYDFSKINKQIFPNDVIIKMITDRVQGNTLSAVFAVREAEICNNLTEYNQRLIDRKLTYDIDSYYRSIWNYCINKINIPTKGSLEIKLACVLSLSTSEITGDMLANLFKESKISPENWIEILRNLEPLVCEFNKGFIIDINDVRVFLKRRIDTAYNKSDIDIVKSELATFYLNNPEYVYERHNLVYELLRFTDYGYLLAEKINVEFMMEALTINQPLENIKKQLEFVLDITIKLKRWDLLFNIFCAVRTLQQSQKTKYWNDEEYIEKKNIFELYPSEIILGNGSTINYSYQLIRKILDNCKELFSNNKFDRAKSLLQNHFGNMPFEELVYYFIDRNSKSEDIGMRYKERLIHLGEVCRYCEFTINIDKKPENLSDIEKRFITYYFEGWFKASKDFDNTRLEATIPTNMLIPYSEILLNYLYALADRDNWNYLFHVVELLEIENLYIPTILQIGAWAVQHGKLELCKEKIFHILKNGFSALHKCKTIDIMSTNSLENRKIKILAYCNFYFLLGFNGCSLDMPQEIIKGYYEHLPDNEIKVLRCLLGLNYYYGSLFMNALAKRDVGNDFRNHLETLLSKKPNNLQDLQVCEFVKDGIRKMVLFAENFGGEYEKIAYSVFISKFYELESKNDWCFTFSFAVCNFLFMSVKPNHNLLSSFWMVNFWKRMSSKTFCSRFPFFPAII